MRMTKAERARVAELEHTLRLAKALRWPTQTPTLVDPPEPFAAKTRGFWWNVHGGSYRVEHAASASSAHLTSSILAHVDSWVAGTSGGKYSSKQGGVVLAATRRDALIAIRIEATRNAAELLARIDTDIEACTP